MSLQLPLELFVVFFPFLGKRKWNMNCSNISPERKSLPQTNFQRSLQINILLEL
jgi:hypothetical protein